MTEIIGQINNVNVNEINEKLRIIQRFIDGVYYKPNLKWPTLEAGTTLSSPLKFADGVALKFAECGAVEFHNGKFYITNVAHRRAIDRTSDVALSTVTVVNTTTETTLWTGTMLPNSLKIGNMFKFHADGVVSNGDSANAADQVALKIKVGGSTVATLEPAIKKIPDGSHWHIDANAVQRAIGVSGSRAVHIDVVIHDSEEAVISVATIDTTANMDVTLTAEWASAKATNTISLYQGYMEYKN